MGLQKHFENDDKCTKTTRDFVKLIPSKRIEPKKTSQY